MISTLHRCIFKHLMISSNISDNSILRAWILQASSGDMLGLSREPQWSLTASTNLGPVTQSWAKFSVFNHGKTPEQSGKLESHAENVLLDSFLETYFDIFWREIYLIVCQMWVKTHLDAFPLAMLQPTSRKVQESNCDPFPSDFWSDWSPLVSSNVASWEIH